MRDLTTYRPVEIPYPDRVHIGTKLTGYQDPPAIIAELLRCEAIEPDTRLHDIADADLAPVAALVSTLYDLVKSDPVAFNSFQWASRFRTKVLALGVTEEIN